MYLVCWETEIDDSKQITAHDDIIIGHWTLLIYECKRIQGWNLPLRQQSINHTETDSDFIVLFNLITAEAINIKKKNTWLGKRGLFSVEMICKWISTCLIMLFSISPPPSRLLFCYVCTSTHWWVMAWQQVKTETQHACTQITFTNMRCHVSKWHWHMCGKRNWSSFQVQRLDESKGSSLKHHCHFRLLRPPSVWVWGSSPCSTQSHLWGRFNTHPAFQNRTDHAFIRFPSQSSRKLRKLCQRQASFPTSGLGLWPSLGRQRWGVMVKHAVWSLHSSGTPKTHRHPKGVW